MNLELAGKNVVVTGGSKGIGLAIVKAFVAEGARVAIVARDPGTLESVRSSFAEQGQDVLVVAADLSDAAAADGAIEVVEAGLGPIDVLVNSAGAARRYEPETLDAEKWRAAFDAKFFSYIHAQDAVLKRLRARAEKSASRLRGAAIVNIVGTGGRQPNPTHVAGGAANAALLLSSAGLARHYARYGIRINSVNPASTYTGRVEQALVLDAARKGISTEQALLENEAALPFGRYARPEEVADVTLFLASERASYITGISIAVAGGADPVI